MKNNSTDPLNNGPKDERITFLGSSALHQKIIEEAEATRGDDKSKVIRRALENYFFPKPSAEPSDVHNFRAPYLSAIPCGPWDEAVNSGADFVVSEDVADELEARDNDVWCRANGDSMRGAGIQDGFVVLLRPYDGKTPRRGEIVLVQVFQEGKDPVGTIKRYDGMNGTKIKLVDGDDQPYELPENAVKVDVIARAVGVVGRL